MAINIFCFIYFFFSVRSVFDAHWGGNALLVYSTTFLFNILFSFVLSVRDGVNQKQSKTRISRCLLLITVEGDIVT